MKGRTVDSLDVIRMNAAKAFALDMLMAGAWTLPKTLLMNTNDEQAPYGPTAQQAADRLAHALEDMDKPTERAPVEAIGPSGLNAKRIEELIIATGVNDAPLFSHREMVRRVIDGLITSGELRVNKKVRFANGACEECGIVEQVMVDCVLSNNCPGCGAQIVKA